MAVAISFSKVPRISAAVACKSSSKARMFELVNKLVAVLVDVVGLGGGTWACSHAL